MSVYLITGGAGFIGSAVIRHLLLNTDHSVINLDKLTYAGNLNSVAMVSSDPRYQFIQGDICDATLVSSLMDQYQPDVIMHLAAESHVDRSIDDPSDFINTNIAGTLVLLEAARSYWSALSAEKQSQFRFHHVSTDEVYGSLGKQGLFHETTSYDPSSPYSASKASSDHLVRAWHRTYGLPVLITNCSNNYGPYQFPEKLMPLMIMNALNGKPLPVYGDGKQVRDWLFVEDHVRALCLVASEGKLGETYNIGGHNEMTNISVVSTICAVLDDVKPQSDGSSYTKLITFVEDRPGHDRRYAIDASKIYQDLGWYPEENFESGLRKCVLWYLDNSDWCQEILDGTYQQERLGLPNEQNWRK